MNQKADVEQALRQMVPATSFDVNAQVRNDACFDSVMPLLIPVMVHFNGRC